MDIADQLKNVIHKYMLLQESQLLPQPEIVEQQVNPPRVGEVLSVPHAGVGQPVAGESSLAASSGISIREMITGKAPTVPLDPLSLRRFTQRQEKD